MLQWQPSPTHQEHYQKANWKKRSQRSAGRQVEHGRQEGGETQAQCRSGGPS